MSQDELSARVLFVEDDPSYAELLLAFLTGQGLTVSHVATCADASAALEGSRFDLLILDANLPDGRAADILHQLGRGPESNWPGRVVVLTGETENAARMEAAEAGADDFLAKNLPAEELHRRLLFHAARATSQSRRPPRPETSRRLLQAIEHAQQVQGRLQTSGGTRSPYDVQFLSRAAEDISGDFFLALSPRKYPDSLLALVADVSGKGVGAAMYTGFLRAWMQTTARAARSEGPKELLYRLDRDLSTVTKDSGDYITAQLLRFDPGENRVRLAAAGHPPPLLQPGRDKSRPIKVAGTPLGLFPEPNFETHEVAFRPGDRVVLVTDGVHEAGAKTGRPYGESRLIRSVNAVGRIGAEEACERILGSVETWTDGPLEDDTLVAVVDFPR